MKFLLSLVFILSGCATTKTSLPTCEKVYEEFAVGWKAKGYHVTNYDSYEVGLYIIMFKGASIKTLIIGQQVYNMVKVRKESFKYQGKCRFLRGNTDRLVTEWKFYKSSITISQLEQRL